MKRTFINQEGGKEYDKFLYEIQKEKMKELWDNENDKEWDLE